MTRDVSKLAFGPRVSHAQRLVVRQARKALTDSDAVALRCFKASLPFPAEWHAYANALRQIIQTGTGTLPVRPAYPADT